MVSGIPNIVNTQTAGPFAGVKKENNYYITPETAKDIFEAAEKKNKEKGKRLGAIIASSALLAAAGIFAFTKGLPKNTYRWLQKWGQHLEEKVNRRKITGKSGPITSFYNYLFRKVGSFSDKSRGVNNLGTVKDLLFTKLMSKSKYTRKIHEKITTVFERLARRSVVRSYSKANSKFSKLFASFDEVNKEILRNNPHRLVTINGVTKTASEWVSEIVAKQGDVKTLLSKGFGKNALQSRYLRMKRADASLDDKVWTTMFTKPYDFKNNRSYSTFVAEDILAGDKIAINKDVNLFRNKISHNILDDYQDSKELVENIATFINPADKESLKLLEILRSKLVTYKKLAGPNDSTLRTSVSEELISGLKDISRTITEGCKKYNYDDKAIKSVYDYISKLEGTLGKNTDGEFQKLLKIYQELLPKEQYEKLLSKTNKTLNRFDKAIRNENDLFFDKLRDLKLGSGPTDVLSILGSIGGVGLGLTMADNKDERISAALQYGIPVVGGVATSVAMTVSLVAGVKSMLIGALSSLVIGDVGSRLDKYRKQINKQQEDIKHANEVKAEIAQKA